jgi:hypothetical protein
MITTLESLAGLRLVMGAKEAGAGSVLAALAAQWRPAPGSCAFVSPVAAQYFNASPVDFQVVTELDAHQAIQALSPDAVVVGASAGRSIEKDLIVAARRAAVPVAAVVDHFWNLWQRFADAETAEKWRYLPDVVFVPSDGSAVRIVSQGAPSDHVRVYRHPLLDVRVPPSRAERLDARRTLALPDNAVVVLFVSEYVFPPSDTWQWEQPVVGEIEWLRDRLCDAAERLSKRGQPTSVLVKLHPAQVADGGFDRNDDACRVVGNLDKRLLFAAADVAIGLNSMLLAEAAAAGTPSFSCHRDHSDPGSWLSSHLSTITELGSITDVTTLFERFAQRRTCVE